MTIECSGFAAEKAGETLKPHTYHVRDLRPNDLEIAIKYSGICHTDLHLIHDDWGMHPSYPLVPGHEIVGVVVKTGSGGEVGGFKVGDQVGVGCNIWSCRECDYCKKDNEQYCKKVVFTYGFRMPDGEVTYGGYSNKVVAPYEFCVKIPSGMDLDKAAPLLCAGITCWSPMKHFGMDKRGKKIGVIGLGGLGHMAVKFGAAFGNDVTVISTSARKRDLAMELGATDFVVMNELLADAQKLQRYVGSLDYIIDTVSAEKPIDFYLQLLAVDGVLVTVGLPEDKYSMQIKPAELVLKRKSIVGSLVGSVKEMKEMMEFCHARSVYPLIEVVPLSEVNTALDRLAKNDVKFRFVLNVAGKA